jgi:phytanoyl-CoA hydroxylase
MFKVYRNQIPAELIDNVLINHERFKYSPLSFFRAQGKPTFEKPILNQYRNQINSIQNPHLLGLSKNFSSSIEKIIIHKNLSSCLKDFTKFSSHIWFQSMFFDNSTGTKLHQDTWYLDTEPNGKLVGVWIALEDIDLSAGPFCIYSNTDSRKVHIDEFNFDELESDKNFLQSFPDAVRFDFTAKKGDILIWDSFSIHGALMPKDETKTRKSITAHFYPAHLKPQDPPVKRFLSIYDHEKPIKTTNPDISKATTLNPIAFQIICASLFAFQKFKVLKRIIMNERNDKAADIRRIE